MPQETKKPRAYSGSNTGSGCANPRKKPFLNRRNTLQAMSNAELLVLEDKFSPAPEPLPSYPPSPNLNRHCTDCMRLRQEARLDNLEEEIRSEVEKYHVPEPPLKDGLKSRLGGPLRWIRQLGVKSSYKFEQLAQKQIPA